MHYKYKKRDVKSHRVKKLILPFLTFLTTAIFIILIVKMCQFIFPNMSDYGFVPTAYGKKVAENVKLAQSTEIPTWIDSQIISVHLGARTGAHLNDVKNIVVHYVGNPNTTAQNNRDYFNKSDTDVSSHFVIGLEGEIIQCIPLWEKSAASNHRNGDTISIEVCHPDKSGEFTEEAYEALIKLIVWLCDNFSLDEKDILRHYDITEKKCPKYYVEHPKEWKKLKQDVKERLDLYEN